MLREQRPDLVTICTPPTLHRAQTIAALRAGAWVWCEKPPVPTLADFDAVEKEEGAEGAEEGPGKGTVGGPYASIVFSIASGRAPACASAARRAGHGRPLVAHCQTTCTATPLTTRCPGAGAGRPRVAVRDGARHPSDGPAARSARAVERGEGHGGRLVHDVETEDVSTALVRFENGAMATVVNSVLSPDEVSRIRIDCERATVELTHLYGHSNDNWRITPAPDVSGEEVAAWQDFGPDVRVRTWSSCANSSSACGPACGRASSGADGRTSLELITALYKSAFTDTTVRAGEIGPETPITRRCTAAPPAGRLVAREEVSA